MLNQNLAVMNNLIPLPLANPVNFSNPVAVQAEANMSLRDVEKSVILTTLESQKFNRTKTAKVLGIGIRTLQRKLKYYREIEGVLVGDFTR